MSDEETKQKTPQGYEIPVPKRKDFEKMLGKLSKPKKPKASRTSRPKK